MQQYNFDVLSSFCKKNNVKLISKHNNTVDKFTEIKGFCTNEFCSKTFQKSFYYLLLSKSECLSCEQKKYQKFWA
jgi:hypothetical protein